MVAEKNGRLTERFFDNRYMAQVKAFPGMPAIAAKLLKLCQNPDTTVSQIEEIVRYDAGLTANILKRNWLGSRRIHGSRNRPR